MCSSKIKQLSLILSYVLPAVISISVFTSIVEQEYVQSIGAEFCQYGSMARNIIHGKGALSGSFQPVDLIIMNQFDVRPQPPFPVYYRNPLPALLTALSIFFFGETDFAVILPHFLFYVGLVLLTNHIERKIFPFTFFPFAAILVACTPLIVHSSIQCYPNTMFAVFFLLVLYMSEKMKKSDRLRPKSLFLFGCLCGLTYLTRTDFIIALPIILIYLVSGKNLRQIVPAIIFIGFGFSCLSSIDFLHTYFYFPNFSFRSYTFWGNLASIQYDITWLRYVDFNPMDIVQKYWLDLFSRTLQRLPGLTIRVLLAPFGFNGGLLGWLVLFIYLIGISRLLITSLSTKKVLPVLMLGAIAIVYLTLYALLRPGARYLIWMIPFLGIVLRFFVSTIAGDTPEGGGRSTVLRMISRAVLCCMLLIPSVKFFAWAMEGKTRHYVSAPTRYYGSDQNDALMKNSMRDSLKENYPYMKKILSPNDIIATNDHALNWYTGKFALSLPLEQKDLEAIEKDWPAVRFIYLDPTIWHHPLAANGINGIYKKYLMDKKEQCLIRLMRKWTHS